MTNEFDFLPATPCYLNGVYSPLREARISVLDRGFIFGDGVYEVVPVYGGQLFRFDQHMARLERSLSELRMRNPLSRDEWREMALRLIGEHTAEVLGELGYDAARIASLQEQGII